MHGMRFGRCQFAIIKQMSTHVAEKCEHKGITAQDSPATERKPQELGTHNRSTEHARTGAKGKITGPMIRISTTEFLNPFT